MAATGLAADGGMGLARENASAIAREIFAGDHVYLAAPPVAGWRTTGSGNKKRLVWFDTDRAGPSLHRAVGGDGR